MKKQYIIVLSSLFISLFIYLFYRTEHTVSNSIFISVFSYHLYETVRDYITFRLSLPETVVYSLPGGLWVFASTIASEGIILSFRQKMIKLFYIPILFVLSLELFQYCHIIKGTFDIMDVVFSIFFYGLGYLVINSSSYYQNIFKPINSNSWFCISTYLTVFLAHVSS